MPYKVFVDDNFHYMDESERYEQGEYETYEEALKVCKGIVDDYLNKNYKAGMSAEDLYELYKMGGDDPFIKPRPEEKWFSAWTYAKQRCTEICKA